MPRGPVTPEALRRHAVARSLFPATTLRRAVERLAFVQADPIRAPARAQDLTLRHRVRGYVAGDLERRYATLDVEEDFLVNYGFLPRALAALMHPRTAKRPWDRATAKRARELLAYVREHGEAHPRDLAARFDHGTVTNYWGGTSSATTHLLDAMHYRGLLRVARRDAGIRIYAAQPEDGVACGLSPDARADALVDAVVRAYAPLPLPTLRALTSRLRHGAPQLGKELGRALERRRTALAHASLDGIDWYWPADEDPRDAEVEPRVWLLAPFDPVVWDRFRFEVFWGWAYRFEAYTPVAKRVRGYYALPLAWRDHVVGWANVSVTGGAAGAGAGGAGSRPVLDVQIGYVSGRPPRDRAFARELDAELTRMRAFLGM